MKTGLKNVLLCFLAAACLWAGALVRDHRQLEEKLIRLHVVANSDSREDQALKLRVRDGIIASLQSDLQKAASMDEARAYLQRSLPKLEQLANEILSAAGSSQQAAVSLGRETFGRRDYDTFSLPAGVYESLRVTIGKGAGKNWWCVAFPALCLPATAQGFQEAAVEAGLSENLTQTLSGEDCQIRFYFLDLLGKLENHFFSEG